MLDLTLVHNAHKTCTYTAPVGICACMDIFIYNNFHSPASFYCHKDKRQSFRIYIFYYTGCFKYLWTPSFFILNNPTLALIDIIALDIFVLLNIIEFYKISKFSGLLLVPYIIWLLFATYLNAGILILN